MEKSKMDFRELLPILWKLIDKKKCAINVASIDNELAVSVITRKHIKRFKNHDSKELISQLQHFLHA